MSQNYILEYNIYSADISLDSVSAVQAFNQGVALKFNNASPYYNGVIDFSNKSKFSIFKRLVFGLNEDAPQGGVSFVVTGYSNNVLIKETVTIAQGEEVGESVNYFNSIISIVPNTSGQNGIQVQVTSNYANGIIGPVVLNSCNPNNSYISFSCAGYPAVPSGTSCTALFANSSGQGINFAQYMSSMFVLPNNQGISSTGDVSVGVVTPAVSNFVYFQFSVKDIENPTVLAVYLLQT